MTVEFPAVTLARYAERIGYRDCAFWGVRNAGDDAFECRRVWTKSQRDMVEWALLEAQEEIEREIRYFLRPKWVTSERHTYGDPLLLDWGYVIEGGVVADTMVAADEPVDYSADPAIVGPLPVGTCALADLHLFHHDTDQEITPSDVSLSGGNVTFEIPWCRLVDPAYQDNPENGWDYSDVATWGANTVDVRCIANDPSTQGVLVWRHNCSTVCASRGCSDYRRTACLYVRDSKLGIVDLTRANYASGVWTATNECSNACCCDTPCWAEVSYHAGLTPITRQAEDTVIRLAHAKMPEEPCGCDVTQRLWRRDRQEPTVFTRERLNCPFGLSQGAWTAWRFAQTMRLVRGGWPL